MIAIIDGDVVAHKACESRWKTKYNEISEIPRDEEGNKIPIEYTSEEDERYEKSTWISFVELLSLYLERVYCNDYLMAIGPPRSENFRTILVGDYKSHRGENDTSKFVKIIKEKAINLELGIEAKGMEADDLIRIWAEECRQSKQEFIIVSIDKDLLMIPGLHYRIHKDIVEEVSEDQALRNYYEQLLKGDPTDGIPGLPKIGDVKAKKLLADCFNEEEMQEVVVNQYIEKYWDKWEEFLLSNGKLIYIAKKRNDYFSLKDWKIVQELRK